MSKTSNLNLFSLGDLVKVKSSFLNEPAGVTAYIYEAYTIGREAGVSLITENGVDLGGFSLQEQHEYLEHIRPTAFFYEFRSVMYLADDFRAGVFDPVFRPGLIIIDDLSADHPPTPEETAAFLENILAARPRS